jgi:hypothetical protein
MHNELQAYRKSQNAESYQQSSSAIINILKEENLLKEWKLSKIEIQNSALWSSAKDTHSEV